MQANKDDIASDLSLLQDVCAQAAPIAMRYFGKNPQVWTKPGDSPVSEADFAVDKLLKQHLLTARPHYGWISEETEDDRPQQSYQRSFVVDPIDGTRGFLDGSAYWCISVAIIENGRPICGVLHCPVDDIIYAASHGNGATRNGERLRHLPPQKSERIVSASKPMEKKLPPAFLKQVSFSRHIPSLAYRIALAAEGAIDIVLIRPNCHDWDIAAADLILQECGGIVTNLDKKPVNYGASPFSHGFLIAIENSQLQDVIDVVHAAKLV